MLAENLFDDLKRRISGLGLQIACIAIDSIFICLWVLLHYIVDAIINIVHLPFKDSWVLLIFQLVFAISTIAPVIIYIFVDIKKMYIRARNEIRNETLLYQSGGIDDDRR